MRMEKKGFEMTVTTVIMIVLSISVLMVLVVFVNSQTGFLSKWFRTYSAKSNVDAIVGSCNSLAAGDSIYSYCCDEKEVCFGDEGEVDKETGKIVKRKDIKVTCDFAADADWSSGRIDNLNCDVVGCE